MGENVFQKIEDIITTTEADVQGWVVQVLNFVQVEEANIAAGLKWLATQIPGIAADLASATALIESIPGATAIPSVAAAITAANATVAGLNAFASAENATGSGAAALVAGYSAVLNSRAATASATSAAISASPTTPPAASTPATS